MIDNYRGGYLKALLDFKELLAERDEVLSHYKILTKKSVKTLSSILDAAIAGRDDLMRFGPQGCDLVQRPDGTFLVKERK